MRSIIWVCSALWLFVSTGWADDYQQQADRVLAESGIEGGFIVHIGCSDGKLTRALRASDAYQVHGLTRDPAKLAATREYIRQSGDYGPVSADLWSSSELPYVDNLVNLVLLDGPADVELNEYLRIVVPNGVLMQRQADGDWKKTVKPRPDNIDEWSHYLHDPSGNAVAHDDVVAQPKHLQWVGSPRWSRHHDRMASMSALVSTNGRMFYVMDEGSRISIQLPPKWKLIARDAFNGTILWKRDIPDWQNHLWPLKSGPTQLTRRLVSTDDEVYFPFGFKAPLSAVDAATGETLRTFAGSDGVEELIHVNGTLLMVVNKGPSELDTYTPANGRVGDQAMVRQFFWDEEPRVLMAYDAKTGRQLWAKKSRVTPLTLSADHQNLYFHDGERLLAMNQATGELAWETDPVNRRRQVTFNFGPRVVVHDDVVLYAGGEGKMFSFDATSGKTLWSAEHPRSGYQSPQDLMVVNGLVWCAPTTSGKDSGVYTGRDPRTGEVKVEFPPNVDTYWFHHRCYIAKATDNFIIPSRTGIEFVDFKQKDWDIHHWVRGGCLYGVMPCNGLTYAPPHNCACYPEAKLYGFNALAPTAPTRPIPAEIPETGRLETGSAFDAVVSSDRANLKTGTRDWPTYRHDVERSGAAPVYIDGLVGESWKTRLGGRLTPPVIADGKVYVAQTDHHTLHALHAGNGQTAWSYTIGARIDSPPTVVGKRVLFGGADGYVYCLNADDGQLAWRYRAAPLDRRTMAYEQLESLWPVHGSVLVIDDVAYAVAGRSMFLDGGLRLLRLNIQTGEKISETLMDERHPETGNDLQDTLQILQMAVGLPDILSTDGKFVYMRSQKFDLEGNRLEIGPNSGDFAEQASVQRGEGTHLFAPMGFLDDSWFHRAYWVNGRSFAGGHGGYHQAGKFAPSGRILVKGLGYVFGYGRKPEYLRWTTTLEHQLFAANEEPPEVELAKKRTVVGRGGGSAAPAGSYIQFDSTASLNPALKPITVEAWFNTTQPNGVIVARGGPLDGFALTVAKGVPQFHIRSKSRLKTITGKRRVVGGWHHVVGVLDAERQMRLYLDGERVAEGEAPGLLTTDPKQGLEIGTDLASSVGEYPPNSGFSGAIDEVRLHFDSVTDEQVAARYQDNEELPVEPVLFLPFDDGSARDMSLHRNNGNLQNARETEGKFGKAIQFTPPKNIGNRNRNRNQQQVDSHVKPRWAVDVPIYVRGMVLADRTLFLVGPPDVIDEEKTFEQITQQDPTVEKLLEFQDEILEGKQGAMLMRVNADTGEIEQQMEIDSLPVWDGLASARGKLFLTTLKGEVVCLSPQ